MSERRRRRSDTAPMLQQQTIPEQLVQVYEKPEAPIEYEPPQIQYEPLAAPHRSYDHYEAVKPKYMGGWAYVFWTIVFTLPVIGIILVVIFSLAGTNTNRKKFARSFLCWLLIDVIILIALVVYLAVLIKNSGLNGDVLTAMDAFFKALPRAIEIAMNNM